MGRSKTQVYLVDDGAERRLIKGTLKEVESKLRGEVEIHKRLRTLVPCKPLTSLTKAAQIIRRDIA